MRLDALDLQHAVICADGFLGGHLAVGDEPQHFDESELVLGVVDLAAEERHSRTVFLRVVDEAEGVVSRARAAAEDADDEVRVVLCELLHRLRTVIDDLEEDRPSRLRHAGERAQDVVIDELAELLRRDARVHVRIEDFKEVAEALALRLLAELLIPEQGLPVLIEFVDVGDRIQTEVRTRELARAIAVALDLAALDVVDARAAEGLARLAGVSAVAHRPHVRRVVGAGGGCDMRLLEEAFLDGELLRHVGGHQHDVHESLMRDLPDDVEELRQVAVPKFIPAPDLGRKLRRPRPAPREEAPWPGSAHAERHVRILRISDDEGTRSARGLDFSELGVEGFHAACGNGPINGGLGYFLPAMIWSVMACTRRSVSGSGKAESLALGGGTAQATPGRQSALSQSSHSFMP